MNKNEILALATEVEEFNSNNAWGYGGARGERYHYKNGTVITIAFAGSRNNGEWSFTKVVIPYKGNDPNHIATEAIIDRRGHNLTDQELMVIMEAIQD